LKRLRLVFEQQLVQKLGFRLGLNARAQCHLWLMMRMELESAQVHAKARQWEDL
jgi:hypothetical protein